MDDHYKKDSDHGEAGEDIENMIEKLESTIKDLKNFKSDHKFK